MQKRPTEMVYCPYCERRVRPIIANRKLGCLEKLFWLMLAICTCGLSLVLTCFVKPFIKRDLECPICGAILKEGNYRD